eukprot:6208638-Pleurochrysis_carterae.AAC.2
MKGVYLRRPGEQATRHLKALTRRRRAASGACHIIAMMSTCKDSQTAGTRNETEGGRCEGRLKEGACLRLRCAARLEAARCMGQCCR